MTLVTLHDKEFGDVVYDKEKMHLFWYWVWERQNIWYRRFVLKEKAPWTEDKILQDYKFTNVLREEDRTTLWYHEKIAGYKGKHPEPFTEKDVIFATFFHRLFNNIPSMELCLKYLTLETYDNEKIYKILNKEREKGVFIWTTAHMTTGVRFKGTSDKLENILYLIEIIRNDFDKVYENLKSSKNLEDLYNRVRMVNGFGPFLAYQYALDVVNSGIFKFNLDKFSVAGPGCKRGIRLVYPDDSFQHLPALKFTRKRQHYFFEKYNYDFKFVTKLGGISKGIHLGNIENCFCEFQKYYRAYIGRGRPKNHFVPTKQPLEVIL